MTITCLPNVPLSLGELMQGLYNMLGLPSSQDRMGLLSHLAAWPATRQ
jgi:hypothetical protein